MKNRRKEWLKKNGPCVKCGSDNDLQVDHVDPRKKFTHRIWSYRIEIREEELRKCQVLCHPCHQEKSANYLASFGAEEAKEIKRLAKKGFRAAIGRPRVKKIDTQLERLPDETDNHGPARVTRLPELVGAARAQ